MKLSYRIVADLKDLHDLSYPYKDLTDLLRLARKDSSLETPDSLGYMLSTGSRIAVAFDGVTIVGRATLTFEQIGTIPGARIDDAIVRPGYETQHPQSCLIFALMIMARRSFAQWNMPAYYIDAVRLPGTCTRTMFPR